MKPVSLKLFLHNIIKKSLKSINSDLIDGQIRHYYAISLKF